MKNLTALIAIWLVMMGGVVWAQSELTTNSAIDFFTKKLPAETRLRSPEERQQIPATAEAAAWQKFTAQTGEWIVEWNPLTGNPHRAFGGQYRLDNGSPTRLDVSSPTRLGGFLAKSVAGVTASAQQFLAEHADLLKLEVNQLELRRAENLDGKWYVSYCQIHDGIPVLFSEIELRLSASGNVMMFGSDFHPNIQVSTAPALSWPAAQEAAAQGVNVGEWHSTEPALCVLPINKGDRFDYHLAYRCEFSVAEPPGRVGESPVEPLTAGRWVSYVDAHNGEILWRFNRVRYSVSGTVSGSVHRNNATDALTSHAFSDLQISNGLQQATTNANGQYVLSANGTSFNLTARLEGKYARVTRADGTAASFTATVQDGQQVNIVWDGDNSQTSERDAYFHTNVAHAFIKAVDPAFTGVDYAMPVRVNITQTCNAFWDGRGINFYRAGGGCRNTAEVPTVVYHEYGHGINDMQYIGRGVADGLTNGALHEGLADINAALLVDDPVVGRGFAENGGGLRNVKNTNRYPQNVSGEVHNDGLILAGALWDLREALGLEKARRYTHFARYGTPDDADLLTACNEFFIEVLIQDDNDGNLANLTPNFSAINQAFAAHGIGTGALLRIAHQERGDAAATENDYLVQTQVRTAAFIGVNPNGVVLHYSTDGVNFKTLPMSPATGATFQARIPKLAAGSLVSYYIEAKDNFGASLLSPANAPQSKLFQFIVGFRSRALEDFETDKGWKIGAVGDNATSGIWTRANPVGTRVNQTLVQPEDDHTPGAGAICFVTGNAGANDAVGANDIDGGRTTLYSPVFDLASYRNPLIRYYRWYSNNAGASPGLDFWEVHVSNDSGKTWVQVERTNETDNSWRKVFFFAQKLLPLTNKMRLRFVAQDQEPGSLVEAAVDDFEILDVDAVTNVTTPAESPLPADLRLHASYPNPFRLGAGLAATIRYELPKPASARIAVYDLNGRVVRILRDGVQAAGAHTVAWSGAEASGNLASTGFYFVVLEVASRKISRKILVVK
jgi:Zn-dependent metalloprotease